MSGNPFLPRPDRDKPRYSPTPPPSTPPLQPAVQSSRHLWSPDPSPFRSLSVRTTVAAAATTLERKLKYATTKLGAYVSNRPANFNGNDSPPKLSRIRSTTPVEVGHIDAHPAVPSLPQSPVEPLQEVIFIRI